MTVALITVLCLLGWGLSVLKGKAVDTSPSGLRNLGFGTLDANALVIVGTIGNATSMAALANTPRVILSIIYVTHNGIMTSMFISQDFSTFAFTPKYLTMSSPAGKQK